MSDIFVQKYRIFSIFLICIKFKKNFNVTQCDYVFISSPHVLLAYDLCHQHFLSVGQLLSDYNWSKVVCLCVRVLTRVVQIITVTRGDL